MDFAKSLLDYGFHAPTIYFPLLISECLLIEPTETETKETIDSFVDAMAQILDNAKTKNTNHKEAPFNMPVSRVDELQAARNLDLTYKEIIE